MTRIKALYYTIRLFVYSAPIMLKIKAGRFYCLRDSPDWLVVALAHLEKPKSKDGSLHEMHRQAKEEWVTRFRKIRNVNASEAFQQMADKLEQKVLED